MPKILITQHFTLTAIMFCTPAFPAEKLPDISIPSEWRKCSENSECTVAGDACRTCGKIILINKKYQQNFKDLDSKLRKREGLSARTCEACQTQQKKLACIDSKCEAQKNN